MPTTTTVRVDAATRRKLKMIAARAGLPMGRVIEQLVSEHGNAVPTCPDHIPAALRNAKPDDEPFTKRQRRILKEAHESGQPKPWENIRADIVSTD